MANWHYFTESREKIGPITGKELKQLVLQGAVTPETFVEDPQGRTGLAKDIKGLAFPEPASSTDSKIMTFICPNPGCKSILQAKEKSAGKTKTCPRCKTSFTVPTPDTPTVSDKTVSVEKSEPLPQPAPFTTPAPFVQSAQAVPLPSVTPPPSAARPFGRILASGKGKGNRAVFTAWAVLLLVAGATVVAFPIIGAIGEQSGKLQEGSTAFFLLLGIALASAVLIYAVFHTRGLAKTEIAVCENGITGIGCGRLFDVNFDLHRFLLAWDKIASTDTTGSAIIIHASGTQYKCYVANPTEIQKIIVNLQQGLYSEQQIQELATQQQERAERIARQAITLRSTTVPLDAEHRKKCIDFWTT